MGRLRIGQNLGGGNPGDTVSVRLPNGEVVQAKAATEINKAKVLVATDEAGKHYAYAEGEGTASVTTRQITRQRPRRKPVDPDNDYFFKVLQADGLIEGFDDDVDLDLTGYLPVRITNTGDGYFGILRNDISTSYVFIEKNEVQTKPLSNTDFIYNSIPTRRLGYKDFWYRNRTNSQFTTTPNSGITANVTRFFTMADRFSSETPPFITGLNSSLPNLYYVEGSQTTSFQFNIEGLSTGSGSASVTIQSNQNQLLLPVDEFNFVLQKPANKFLPDINYEVSYNANYNNADLYYIFNKDGLSTAIKDINVVVAASASRQWENVGGWPATSASTTNPNHTVNYKCTQSHAFDVTQSIIPYVMGYAHSSHAISYEAYHRGEYAVTMTRTREKELNVGLTTTNGVDTYTMVAFSELTFGTRRKKEDYYLKQSETDLIIEGVNCAIYYNIIRENEHNYPLNQGSFDTLSDDETVLTYEEIIQPIHYDICVKIGNTVYEISDFAGDKFDYQNKVFIETESVEESATSVTLSSLYVIIGASEKNYALSNQIVKSRTYRKPYGGIAPQTIETTATYNRINRTVVGDNYYFISMKDGSNTRGVLREASVTSAQQTGQSYDSINVTLGNVIEDDIFFCWFNFYPNNPKNYLIRSTDWGNVLVDFLWYNQNFPQSTLYTVLDENGNETVELAIVEIPTTTTPETLRADIYRFNTSTLKWERRPNAITPVSPLTDTSSFVSYHPTPSNSRKKKRHPPRS